MLLRCLCNSSELVANLEQAFVQFICLPIAQLRAGLWQWCYVACKTPVHLTADTEQVIVQWISLHMLFANWALTCLALTAFAKQLCLDLFGYAA